MKFELERGSLGYIKKKKIRQALLVLLMVALALIMFVTGLLINKTKANICSILAMLMVVPAAKFLVTFIVMFPYKGVTKERYDKVKGQISDDAVLMTDMVITSPEKVMNLDFIVITDNQVIGLIGRKKQDPAYIEKYLKKSIKDNKVGEFTVKICDNEDLFYRCLPTKNFEDKDSRDACHAYLRTLVV